MDKTILIRKPLVDKQFVMDKEALKELSEQLDEIEGSVTARIEVDSHEMMATAITFNMSRNSYPGIDKVQVVIDKNLDLSNIYAGFLLSNTDFEVDGYERPR